MDEFDNEEDGDNDCESNIKAKIIQKQERE